MIFKREIALIVDAYSTGNMLAPALMAQGIPSIHIRSTTAVKTFYRTTFRPDDFIEEIDFTELETLRKHLSQHRVIFVLPGCECGVELAAYLAEAFAVAHRNAGSNALLWRNKYQMHEALKRAGVRSIAHCLSDRLTDIEQWVSRRPNRYPVVLKPVSSVGTDNVHICLDAQQLRQAFTTITQTETFFFQANKVVLAQEFLHNQDFDFKNGPSSLCVNNDQKATNVDVEYCVNTVSHEGRHFVSEIIRVYRTRIADSPVHDYNRLLCPVADAEAYAILSEYIFNVLDALGLRNGVGHSELMIVKNKPVLLETAARLPGGIDLSAYTKALGYNQLDLYIQSLINPQTFLARLQLPRDPLRFHSSCVFLISPVAGTIVQAPDLRSWQNQLTTLHSIKLQDRGELSKTAYFFDSPGSVFLLSKDPAMLDLDRQIIRKTEPAIYQRMLSPLH